MKLSIITINLNNREGLERTIQSVVSQTFTDFEYIIIDGGSTDGSVEVIQALNPSIPHSFTWLSEPDTGIYNAMNKGIKLAKGEYLLFLNSGDCFASINVLEIVNSWIKPDIDILAGYVKEQNDDGNNKYPPENFTFRSFYNTNIPHQAEFIKKELLLSLGCYNESLKLLSDYEVNIKALCKNATYKYTDILVSYVDTNGISYQKSNSQLIHDERKQIFSANIPLGILKDYEFFFANEKEFHSALKWVKDQNTIFKILRFIYNHFSERKEST